MKVLIAAPVHNRGWILPDYLKALEALDTGEHQISYFFLVNNSTDNSLEILTDWAAKDPDRRCDIKVMDDKTPADERYERTEEIYRHFRLIRERIREVMLINDYDYLFSVDTDIMVRPETLTQLMEANKDFIAATLSNEPSGSFRTVNATDVSIPMIRSPYRSGPKRSAHHVAHTMLKADQIVEVGVTGACFLATRKVMELGTYLYAVVPGSVEAQLLTPTTGEDEWFAISLWRHGFKQYLHEGVRLYHCMVKERLTVYQEAFKKYQDKTAGVLADRDYMAECASCQDKRRKSDGKKSS